MCKPMARNPVQRMIRSEAGRQHLARGLAVWFVLIFAFLGLEHSVANTVLFTIVGLVSGINVVAAAGNIAIALLGNFVGGGLLIGLYYAYVNDDRAYLKGRGTSVGS